MKESGPDGRFGAVGSQIAASNERLLEVSDKRITSFVGFQEISGDVSAHSASPSQQPVRREGLVLCTERCVPTFQLGANRV